MEFSLSILERSIARAKSLIEMRQLWLDYTDYTSCTCLDCCQIYFCFCFWLALPHDKIDSKLFSWRAWMGYASEKLEAS